MGRQRWRKRRKTIGDVISNNKCVINYMVMTIADAGIREDSTRQRQSPPVLSPVGLLKKPALAPALFTSFVQHFSAAGVMGQGFPLREIHCRWIVCEVCYNKLQMAFKREVYA